MSRILERFVLAAIVFIISTAGYSNPNFSENISGEMNVRRLKKYNMWEVTWTFSEPIQTFAFKEIREKIRKDWQPQTKNSEIKYQGKRPYFFSSTPTRMVKFRFPDNDVKIDRQYIFTLDLGKGSSTICLCHLVPYVFDPASEAKDVVLIPLTRVTLESERQGDFVVLAGETARSKVVWKPTDSKLEPIGYVGSIKPIETSGYVVVNGNNLPRWMTDTIEKTVDPVLNLYLARFPKLKVRPQIFNVFKEIPSGSGLQGEVQDQNSVIYRVNWSKESEPNPDRLMRVIAHELAHLWAGHLFGTEKTEDVGYWSSEGLADALAWEALVETRLVTAKVFKDWLRDDLSECRIAMDINGRVMDTGSFQYSCGRVIYFLVGEAERRGKSEGLFSFLKVYFSQIGQDNSTITVDSLLKITGQRFGKDFSGAFKEMVVGRKGSTRAFDALVNAAGLKIAKLKDYKFKIDMGPEATRAVMRQLMLADCDSGYGYYYKSDLGFEVSKDCRTFRSGQLVTKIEGLNALKDGPSIVGKVADKCIRNKNAKVHLGINGSIEPLQVPCPKNRLSAPEIIGIDLEK